MFKSYIKIAFRNLLKHSGYSFINIFGLTLGLTTSILIFLYVQDEKSYDSMHENAEAIYRLESWSHFNDNENHWAATQGFLIPDVVSRYPEIVSAVRIMGTSSSETFNYENDYYNEESMFYADSTFFDVFTFKILKGASETALDAPDKVVLTESTAHKYFGAEDPIGKVIKRGNRGFKVSAVIEDIPHNSHFHFNLLLPMSDMRRRNRAMVDGRQQAVFYSYIKLVNQSAEGILKKKFADDIYKIRNIRGENGEVGPVEGLEVKMIMNPITGIHLNGHAEKEIESNGDAQYVYIFSTIALFVLIIASFNYMNLATARSAKRAKEVGMRKVLGAEKTQIFSQFLGESFFFTFLATLLALIIVILLIPTFNDFTGKVLDRNVFKNQTLMIGLSMTYLVVSALSGFYPSLFLSRFKPLRALKSNVLAGRGTKGTLYLRRGLVILQFGISIFLIIGASTVYNQLQYIENKDLGFSKEQVVVINLPGRGSLNNIETIKQQMLTDPSIVAVAKSSAIPGERVHVMSVRVPDLAAQDADDQSQQDNGLRGMRIMSGDEDLAEVYGIEIIDGRDLSKEMITDASEGFLLNEAAIKEFGLEENPVGRRFEYVYGLPQPKVGRIIGVMKDFHYASLHTEVEPLMVHVLPQHAAYLNVRIKTGDTRATLASIEKTWLSVVPTVPFDYFFLDSNYDNQYRTETSMGKIITFFTLLAVVIACMGLFGLASFITEQRTKEIGVRKVLGATIKSIMVSLSSEFVVLIVIANILAWFPAYYFLNGWLDNFAFRTQLSLVTPLVAAVAALSIALLTISFKTYRAARTNPVKSLRYE